MLPLPTLSTSPSGNVSNVITPVTQPTAALSVSTASSGSRSSKSGRSKRGGSSVARRRVRRVLDNTQKHYAPHICRFSPYRPPSAAVLDPFPNLRINSLCMAGLSSLVTVHRSGLRLYRERHLGIPAAGGGSSNYSSGSALTSFPAASVHGLPAQRTPTSSTVPVLPGVSTASGVFELLETRTDFQVRESYLCTSMQPVLIDDAVLVSKWSRYFCVASGSDRVVHSVSVMSSGAHFCLHHEKHQGNKVVCLHCTQMATEPFHPTSLRPAVVSVDEVGGVVLFDVEREVAVVLEKAPLWFQQSTGAQGKDTKTTIATEVTDDAAATTDSVAGDTKATPPPQQQTSLLAQHLSPDEEDHVVDAMEKVPLKERSPYHLEHGVATRVTLIGPCLELCNHCHNAFMSLHASRGYTLVSLYICSRAQDLPTTAPADGSSPNTAAAELNVTLLRVLWGPRRAFVLEEVQLVREAAPTDVCEAGVATAARPYQVALPMTVLLARPALQLWQLCACTGEHLDTRSLYQTSALTKKGVRRGGHGGGQPRAASEFVIHWVPLGRHQLTVVQDDRAGPQSWFCIAAVTDDDTVLLLGRDPQSLRTPSPFTNVVVSDATIAPLRATEAEAEKFRDADLEGWLDDLHTSPAPSPVPEVRTKDISSADTPAIVVESAAPPAATPAVVAGGGSAASASTPYTVLMVLYSPRGHSLGKANGDAAAPSVAAGVLSIMPDLRDNRLLLFMADEEALLSVPLPFAGAMPTVTDKDQPGDSIDVRSGGTALRGGSSSPSAVAGAVAAAAGAEEQISSDAAGGGGGSGYSQYLWGATSKAVTAASQGWSTSMQRWAPSTTSYFSFSGSPVTSSAPVQSTSSNTQSTAQQPPPCSSSPPQQSQQKNAMVESPPPKAGEVPAVRPPSVQQAQVAASTVADSFRSFSIARPLMAAVFHFTGEDQEPPAAAVVRPTTTTQKASADESHHASPPQQQQQQQQKAVEVGKEHLSSPTAASLRKSPMPAPTVSVVPLPSNEHSFHSADVRSSSEASTARTAASLAVPIRVARSSTRERSGSRALSSAGSQHSGHQRRSNHQHHNRHPRSHFHSSQSAPSLLEDDTTATVSLSVYEGAHGGSKSRRRRDRQSAASSEASPSPPSSLPHTVTLEDGSAAAAAIRASYMESQMQLLMQEADPVPELGGNGDRNSATAATEEPACRCRTFEEVQYELRRLVDVEEPLERNMIQYSWKDGHNDLYIQLSVEQDSLEQAEQQQQQRGSRRPVEFSTSHDAPLRLVTNTSADVADGVHSVDFLSTYHSVVAWRAETASYGNCFAFADYFRTLQVPQHVLDVQERDKCRLELEDLRLQQAKDMTAVHPYELMSVCQNEERRSSEDAWKLHATFPFDDERDGRVVDLHWLNRTAGSTAASPTPEWRWATEREVRMWAEEEGSAQSRTKRVQSLVKELKDWTVGPWEYAERWPSREESSGKSGTAGLPFKWSPTEAAVHRCRRRRLTRLRVNVPELRRQTDLTDAHIRELGALRDELGL